MKRVSFFAMIIGLAAFVWSCGPTGENSVTINFESSNKYPAVGDTFTITVSATSSEVDLKSMKIEGQVSDSSDNIVKVIEETADASGLTYNGTFDITVPAAVKSGVKITFIITSTDKNDGTETEQFKLDVASYMTKVFADKEIGHAFGPMNGAFDLVKGLPMFQNDAAAEKDLIDITENDQPLSETLKASNESGTQFVDLSVSYDIKSLNSGNIKSVWSERSPSQQVLCKDGTKILARL
ncbi:MAG: hypothetical protein KDC92_16920, partial [Bacteroidetes bacterium]|nr:hypothetical protein [Bacteroidota bacterium]